MPKSASHASSRLLFSMRDSEVVRITPARMLSSPHPMNFTGRNTAPCLNVTLLHGPFHLKVPRDTSIVPVLVPDSDNRTDISPALNDRGHHRQMRMFLSMRCVVCSLVFLDLQSQPRLVVSLSRSLTFRFKHPCPSIR